MIKAVIFDVDGTLIDSVDFHARAWQDAFREFGHEIDLAKIRGQIGKGGDQLMPVFLSKDELHAIADKLDERRGTILHERYLAKIKAFPEVRALFQRILKDGKQILLASSAKGEDLQTYKELARIEDLLDAETSSDDADKSKPHPDIFQAAMSKLPGVEPDQTIVIGDTPYDAEAAGRAGLRAIGVRCGGWPDGALKQAGCIAVYRDPADLLAHYDASPLATL
ncbi:HAD family hydrolase [Beijerinckia sp. L45]|uniref:HAD family hydrolase n=1 Tax=Beijerinckia sp. L45 TaxID=1641855 RepID=UPI00131EB24E|nr:HAD family hydrolase [Beijerinckia sp. L45]